jgi:hypothetical protein
MDSEGTLEWTRKEQGQEERRTLMKWGGRKGLGRSGGGRTDLHWSTLASWFWVKRRICSRMASSNSARPSCPLPSHSAPPRVKATKSDGATWIRGRKFCRARAGEVAPSAPCLSLRVPASRYAHAAHGSASACDGDRCSLPRPLAGLMGAGAPAFLWRRRTPRWTAPPSRRCRVSAVEDSTGVCDATGAWDDATGAWVWVRMMLRADPIRVKS